MLKKPWVSHGDAYALLDVHPERKLTRTTGYFRPQGREVSNSAVESSWKLSSFPGPVSHEYPALATEGLWRKQAHNNWERFVTTGVKWMKPRGRQVMQFMEKKNLQLLLGSIHHSLWPSRNVLTDTKHFVWHSANELEWLLLTALFPNSRAPSSGDCVEWLSSFLPSSGQRGGVFEKEALSLCKQLRKRSSGIKL